MGLAVLATGAAGASGEEIVLKLLYQLIAILVLTRIVVALAQRAGQTAVAGEILGGILMGPSFLGAIFPDAMHRLFDPSTGVAFTGIAQIGLVLLMFQIGLEFEFGESLARGKRTMVVVSALGIALPFALGYLTAPFFVERMEDPRPPLLGFRLFFATAMSITAIPILGRIFMELELSRTRIAALVIGSAAIDDVCGWLILGVVAAVVHAGFAPWPFLVRIALLLAYLGIVFFIARPLLKRAIDAHLVKHGAMELKALAGIVICLFCSAAITSNLGVFAIIGGFVIGVALHDDRRFVAEWRARVAPLVTALFLPVFFTYTGLRTDVGSLHGAEAWGLCALVLAIAFIGKLGGAYLGARLTGESHLDSLSIGVCMNTRALMELVALNVGYDLGVLPRPMYTMLVIMAIVSTFITTPLIRRWMNKEPRAAVAEAAAV